MVVPAHLPEEAEIDRLRDSMPKDAKEMLTGVIKLTKAWEILTKRFGDKDLIATKLKNELKALSISEKYDHEKIIALVIKIRSLVSRLETVKASEALKYDGEFVAAVYFQLPERQKIKWLEFDSDKFDDKWAALIAFLDDAYEKAVKEKLLLACYTPVKDKKVILELEFLLHRLQTEVMSQITMLNIRRKGWRKLERELGSVLLLIGSIPMRVDSLQVEHGLSKEAVSYGRCSSCFRNSQSSRYCH